MDLALVLGVFALLFVKVWAASRLGKIKEFLLLAGVAELGLLMIGIGLGNSNGTVGAGFHFAYQLLVRLLIYFAVVQLIKVAKDGNLTGIASQQPLLVTLAAFGMFSALGVSPFKGAVGKLLIVYSLVESQQLVLAGLVMLAGLIEAGCFLKLLQVMLVKTETSASTTKVTSPGLIGLAVVTALITLFQEPILHHLSGSLAELESPWSMLVLVPYIGAFAVYLLGKVAPLLRNVGALAVSAASLVFVWQSPDLDSLSRLFALVMTGVCLLVVIYSTSYFKNKANSDRYFFFLLLLQASLIGITTTDQLGNFYAFWEIMTWSSFLLVIQEQTREALAAGYKYFMMCTAGAYALLVAGLTLQSQVDSGSLTVIANNFNKLPAELLLVLPIALFAGFAVKIGLVPVHSWLPAAHPVAPSSISAPMSGILTKIGIFGLLKFVFLTGQVQLGGLLAVLGAITVLYGDLKALKQTDVKRMLAFSTMAQVGEIAIALGVMNYVSVVGGLSHVVNHAIMKNLLFLAIGAIIYRAKSQEISRLKGIGRQMPLTALCFSIGILGIMGLPPFAGFGSKFMMLYGLIQADQWLYAGVILLGSFIGSFYYLRLIRTIFFEKYEGPAISEVPVAMLIPSVGLAALVVVNGLFPQLVLSWVQPAADVIAAATQMTTTVLPDLTINWPVAVLVPMVGAVVAYFAGKTKPAVGGWVGVIALVVTTSLLANTESFSLAAAFAILIAGVGALNLLYSVGYMDHSHAQNRFYFFFLMMIGGLIGVALSKDLFSFFTFWEIMSSWTLYFTIIHEQTEEALTEGFKYFSFNYAGASLMMFGIILLLVGTGGYVALTLITIGLFMKAAMLPVRIDYQMHPPAAPTPVSGYISSVLLKSAPFSVLVFMKLGLEANEIMAWVSGATILWAAVMALLQTDIKKVLIFSTVSQMGYIMLGISLGTALGVAGGIFHLVNHMFFKNLLFLGAGAVMYRAGVKSLEDVGGLATRMPITVGAFTVGALATIGIPPFNGFFSKWMLYQAAMAEGQVVLAMISLLASVLTMAYLVKFLHSAFFGQLPQRFNELKEAPMAMLVPMVVLAGVCILFGLFPQVPLGAIAQLQQQLGLPVVEVETWSLGPLSVLLLISGLVATLAYGAFQKKVRYTEVYTCGNTDLQPEELHVSASHLYEAPRELLKEIIKGRG